MTKKALNRAFLARQMLLRRERTPILRAIGRLVALQAQQPRPPFIGLWSRVEGFRREDLARPIGERKVVRATMLRATLHLLRAEDYPSFRACLQPALTGAMESALRNRAKDLDVEAVIAAAHDCFGEQPRTFTELRAALLELFPKGDERAMGYAVRTHLPLVVVPSEGDWGFSPDPKFALASSWLGQPEAAAEECEALVLRYLAAFGPATAADAQTWTGLGKLQSVMEALRPRLRVFRDERKGELFDLPKAPRPAEDTPAPVRFLPGFDNVVLGHADRSRVISKEHRPRVVTKNLQVLPTFLVDGFVAGTWAIDRRKNAVTLVLSPFEPLAREAEKELAEEGEELIRFLEPEVTELSCKFAF